MTRWQLCKFCLLAGLINLSDAAHPVTAVTPALVPPYPTSEEFLDPHNAARAHVKVEPLQWNITLAAYALTHGQKQRDSNKCNMMEHSSGGVYGENVFWGSHLDVTAEWVVEYWISEQEAYNYGENRCEPEFLECGHYTQIVWRDSSQLGCAAVHCHDSSVLMICEYFPPGNIAGKRPF